MNRFLDSHTEEAVMTSNKKKQITAGTHTSE